MIIYGKEQGSKGAKGATGAKGEEQTEKRSMYQSVRSGAVGEREEAARRGGVYCK